MLDNKLEYARRLGRDGVNATQQDLQRSRT
jgi:hypothetical protein